MGLKNWITKKLTGIDTSDASSMEKLATEFLKNNMAAHTETLQTARKLNKAKLIQMQERQLRQELLEGLEGGEDEGEDEEPESVETQITNALLSQFMPKNKPTTEVIEDYASKLTPEEQQQIKEKFGF